MMHKMFAVHDSKVAEYLQPFPAATAGAALRMWADTIADEKTQFSKHPEDFTLFELAEFDSDKGVYNNLSAPKSLGNALEYKNRK